MAIRPSDLSDDHRRRMEQEDRLAAEELMVSAMAASFSSSASVSSKRRNRVPGVPPAPTQLGASPDRNNSNSDDVLMSPLRKYGGIAALFLAVSCAVTVGTVAVVTNRDAVLQKASLLRANESVRLQQAHVPGLETHFPMKHGMFSEGGSTFPTFFQRTARDVSDQVHDDKEKAVMWRIPLSGDEAWTEVMGMCHDLTQASDEHELLGQNLHAADLKYVSTPKGKFLNLDLSTWDGVLQAKAVDLLSLDVDVITSPLLPVLELFQDVDVNARLFCTFRPPVQRLLALFYHMKDISSRYYDPALMDVSIDQYVDWPDDRPEFNFMVKSLVGKLIKSSEITDAEFEIAKNVLAQKFIVLMANDKFGSWTKLQSWMGWPSDSQQDRLCEDRILTKNWLTFSGHDPLSADSPSFWRLQKRNSWDVKLYEYATELYDAQTNDLLVNEK